MTVVVDVYIASMNELAISKINASMSTLPVPCQSAIKQLVCSNVYLRCIPDVNLTDPRTYSSSLYHGIVMPFQRPCRSMCETVKEQCLGIPELLGSGLNCDATMDYSGSLHLVPFPDQFDDADDDAICTVLNQTLSIQTGKERYLGQACRGYVDTIYIAASTSYRIAPMARPGVGRDKPAKPRG